MEVTDCDGLLLMAGIIDIQVHFRDPGQTHKEDMISGSMSAISGGVTSVVCQPNTNPTLDSATILEYLYYKSKQEAYCNIFAYACITKGMKSEEIADLEELAKIPNVVGFTDDGLPVLNSKIMREAFRLSQKLKKPIAQHAEDPILSAGNSINEGIASKKLGINGIPNISEAVIVDRDIRIHEDAGGHYHVLHVSTKEALDAIRLAKKKGLNVTCEVSPHHFSFNDEEVLKSGTNAKMNPPLRSEEDRLALIEGMSDGTIDAIATDHAPHSKDEKGKDLSNAPFGIIGLETMLPASLKLYFDGKISLSNLVKMLTIRPAEIIGIDRGSLKVGKIADFILVDLNQEYEFTEDLIVSRSKNSPFIGKKMRGKVVKTFINGKKVFDIDE
jgi:dihydroorotase